MNQANDFNDLIKDVHLTHTVFESSECYGMGKYIRKYGYYPQWLPLFVATDHGPSQRDVPTYVEFNSGSPHMLFHSQRLVTQWEEVSMIPCDVMMSPFVFYRRTARILKSNKAKGTLAFPVHTTDLIENNCDYDLYAMSLLALPLAFQPVSVCLYYMDVRKGRHKIFEKHNIPVYTAGHIYDSKFVERFYDILSNFSFATSNHAGSYLFYAVEMGVPFFIYGKRTMMINNGDPNCPDDLYNPLELSNQHNKITELFDGIRQNISPMQKKLVEAELGIHDGVSRCKMLTILYGALLKWCYCSISFSSLYQRVYKNIPESVKTYMYLFRYGLIKEARISSHLTAVEKISLHIIAKQLNPSPIAVEIGSYLGASSNFIANGVKNKMGTLFCIDTWENQTMPEGERDTYDEFIMNTAKYKNIIVPVRGRSSEMVSCIKGRIDTIDLLFIDGDHSYEACRNDWEQYSPFLKLNSVVIFHDTGWADGVIRVITDSVEHVADKIIELPNMKAFKIREQVCGI